MNTLIAKKLLVAGLLLCSVPGTLLAQQDERERQERERERQEEVRARQEKEKEKQHKMKNKEQIIITRAGDSDEETVIRIKGDRITVNGRDIEDLKDQDVTVRRNKIANTNITRVAPGQGWSRTHDDQVSLYREDENRAMLGVVTEDHDDGAEIQSVTKGSAAEKAGLKRGDVITRIGGDRIEDADDVTKAIRSRKPGDRVDITVERDDREERVTAELGHWKGVAMTAPRVFQNGENFYIPSVPPATPDVRLAPSIEMHGDVFAYGFGRPRLGLSIQDTDEGRGVKVLEVEDESAAEKAGMEEDDVITHIDGKEVNSTDEITRLLRSDRNKTSYEFRVNRDGRSRTIEVKMPRKLKSADL